MQNKAGEEEEVLAATEHERYQQDVRAAVEKDIQQVLHSSKAYMKHLKGPPVISKAALESLSVPRPARLHRENKMCQGLGLDPAQYAKYKAFRLEQERMQEETRQGTREVEQCVKNQSLAAYRAWKAQREQLQLQREEKDKEATRQYGQAMASHVRDRAEQELQRHRDKLEQGRLTAARKHEALSRNFL